MKITKRVHPGYKEFLSAQKTIPNMVQIFGKYQYIFESDKGRISLIELPNHYRDGETVWEIYCLEGDLFEDVERFKTKEEAEKQVKKYLIN